MIAPSGEAFVPSPENLSSRCDLPRTDRPLLDYAIKNAGTIELRLERDIVRIRARPGLLSAASIEGLKGACSRHRLGRDARVVLQLVSPPKDPPPRIVRGVRSAIEMLDAGAGAPL
jgi:hypothetical protein